MNTEQIDKTAIPKSNIVIVDTDERIRKLYKDALEKEGHTVYLTSSGNETYELINNKEIDLILLGYSLKDENAEDIVMGIKHVRSRIRILLIFDKNDNVNRRDLLQRLPIQGCHEKGEGIEKLFLWIDVVLKNLGKLDMIRIQLGTIKSQIKIIERNKEGLRYIISAMPETINRLQPLDKFIRGILIQLNGFIEADNSFLATIDENNKLILLVGTGEFDMDEKTFLTSNKLDKHMDNINALRKNGKSIIGEYDAYLPLTAKDEVIGVFYLEKKEKDIKELEIEMLRLFVSQTAITIENSNLFKLATVDSLTGLYVRRYFLQRFQEVLQFASRYGGQAVSLLILDIDHFKYINDKYGHPQGDKVLSQVTQIIRESIRATDVTGRLGGEEFSVLLIDTSLDKAKELAEMIRRKVEKYEFIINDKLYPVTISIGISNFNSYLIDSKLLKKKSLADVAMHDLRRMLTAADKALYKSKEQGRNRVTVSDPLLLTTD